MTSEHQNAIMQNGLGVLSYAGMHSNLSGVVLFVGVLTGAIITCVVAFVHGEGLCCCEVGASGSRCWYGLVWKLGGRVCKAWVEHAFVAG